MKLSASPVDHPEGEGLGASLPDSIIVGRTGPIPSIFVLRGLVVRDELLCSTGVSLFAGRGVSTAIGGGGAVLSIFGCRAAGGCESDSRLDPPAARAPAARISSSVRVGGAAFFWRDLDFRGVGAGLCEGISSEGIRLCFAGSGVCLECSGFFSRATITSCACIFPSSRRPQSRAPKNVFSTMPPDKRMTPFTNPRS